MIGILHCGGLSDSPLGAWVAHIVRALAREGRCVHLFSSEKRPASFDPASESYLYEDEGGVEARLFRETPFPGSVVMHELEELGDVQGASKERREVLAHKLAELFAGRELVSLLATDPDHAGGLARAVTEQQPLSFAVLAPPASLRRLLERRAGERRPSGRGPSRVFCVDSDAARSARDRVCGTPEAARRLALLQAGIDTSLYSPVGARQRVERVAALATGLDPSGAGRVAGARRTMEAARASGTHAPDEGGMDACLEAVGTYDPQRPDHDAASELLRATWPGDVVVGVAAPEHAESCAWALLGALPTLLADVPNLRVVMWGGGTERDRFELALLALAAGDEAWLRRILHGVGSDGGPPPALRGASSEQQFARWVGRGAEHVDPRRVIMTGALSESERRALLPCLDFALREADAGISGVDGLLAAMAAGTIPLSAGSARIAETGDTLASYLAVEVVRHASLPDACGAWPDAIARAVVALQPERDALRASFRQITIERHDWRSIAVRLAADLPRPRQTMSLLGRDSTV